MNVVEENMADSAERRVRGATIEDALNQARTEFGTSDVRVLHATRLRRGGVGGFFAKDLGVELVVAPAHDAQTLERQLAAGREVSAGSDLYRQLGREAADAAIAERAALLLAEDDRAHAATTEPKAATPASVRRTTTADRSWITTDEPVQPSTPEPSTVVTRTTTSPDDERPAWAVTLAPLVDEPAPRTSVAAALSKLGATTATAETSPVLPEPAICDATAPASPTTAAIAAMLDEGDQPSDEALAPVMGALTSLVDSIVSASEPDLSAARTAAPVAAAVTTDDLAHRDVYEELAARGSDDAAEIEDTNDAVVLVEAITEPGIEPLVSELTISEPVVEPLVSERTISEPVISEPVISESIISEPLVAAFDAPDETVQDAPAAEPVPTIAAITDFEPSPMPEPISVLDLLAAEPDAAPAVEPLVQGHARTVDPVATAVEAKTVEAISEDESAVTPASVTVTAEPAPQQDAFVADWASWAVSRTLRTIAEERRRAITELAAVEMSDTDARAYTGEEDDSTELAVTDADVRDETSTTGTVTGTPTQEAIAMWRASRELKHRQTETVEVPVVTTPSTQYVSNLRAAGLPDAYLELVVEGASVRDALATVETATPYPGELDGIVVVVGPAQLVTPWAQALAKAVGLDPREVMTVSPATVRDANRLTGAEDAFAWRCTRHGGTRLVALEVPTLSNMTGYVRSVLKALRPTQVRLLTRADDLAAASRWLEVAPAAVLDVVGISRSRRPVEFLSLDAPVATVDGEAMDAGSLAASLLEHCCR
jgi:hypothetical protein